jgi:hypothetical protein
MQQLTHTERPSARFDAHLRHEYRKPPDIMPPETDPKTERQETTGQPPAATSKAMRTAYRKAFMQAFRHMQSLSPHAHQSQMGWVMARVSRSLTDNPFMGKQGVEALVESLVAGMPAYEEPTA